ncbi:MAG: hypothetical protein SAK29_38635, partial [Scytonema sp. PMC 1069.18]|nr:hypothetical protein [Scytonema sp. PMC 1069.18]
MLNTEAALRYYVNQAKQFDTVYLLGSQNLSTVDFSIGKKTQRNKAHFIELYGALAARHFWKEEVNNKSVVLISRQNHNQLLWNDLPDTDGLVKSSLINATRFAYVWLGDIAPELATAGKMGIEKFRRAAPWFSQFFHSRQGGLLTMVSRDDLPDFNNPTQQGAIEIITAWCKDYVRWMSDIHQCDGDSVQLFDDRVLDKLDGQLRTEELADLIIGDNRDRTSKLQDTPQRLKEKLIDTKGSLT